MYLRTYTKFVRRRRVVMRERERVMQRPKWNPTTFLKEKKKKKCVGGGGKVKAMTMKTWQPNTFSNSSVCCVLAIE